MKLSDQERQLVLHGLDALKAFARPGTQKEHDIDELKKRIMNEPDEVAGFSFDDFASEADENLLYDLTPWQVCEIMDRCRRDYDASVGFDWDNIHEGIHRYCAERSIFNRIKASHEAGMCPDCGDEIPRDVSDGEGCDNCGHVFHEPQEDDD